MYMKRMGKILLWRAAGAIAAELSRISGRRTSPPRIDIGLNKIGFGSKGVAPVNWGD
jgi:hypothetical protein